MNGFRLLFWPHFRTQNRSALLLEMLWRGCARFRHGDLPHAEGHERRRNAASQALYPAII
jgi:hypothetical protein